MPTVEQLLERIEAIEQQLAQGFENLNPSVYSLNEQGQIEAKISGQIEAKSLTLNIEGATAAREINWKAGNTIINRIIGSYTSLPEPQAELALNVFTAQTATLGLRAITSITEIYGETGFSRVKIIDNNGLSSFLQLAGGTPTKPVVVSFGAVDRQGEALSGNSEDFTVKKEGALYVVTWNTPRATNSYQFVATPDETGVFATAQRQLEGVVVRVLTPKNEVVEEPWSFIAISEI